MIAPRIIPNLVSMIELKRGDIVLFAERGKCTGKLRPGVVVQRDSTLQDAPSVTLCGLTSFAMPTHRSRIAISPSLRKWSRSAFLCHDRQDRIDQSAPHP
ncbi:MAG: type II toxin-antitoxin system PemK/MazF family toxin [Sphingomonas sp.]